MHNHTRQSAPVGRPSTTLLRETKVKPVRELVFGRLNKKTTNLMLNELWASECALLNTPLVRGKLPPMAIEWRKGQLRVLLKSQSAEVNNHVDNIVTKIQDGTVEWSDDHQSYVSVEGVGRLKQMSK